MPLDTSISMADLLAFYADAGVDEAMADEPVDRFAETAVMAAAAVLRKSARTERAAPQSQATRPASPPRASAGASPGLAAVPDGSQAALARELAANAGTLDELRRAMEGFEGCNLKSAAKTLVFSDGNPQADLMLVGEAPGRDEDLEGLPFVGRSGQLLDRMLAAIGRDRGSAYIANIIPWRPPGNRAPTPLETEICRPFIERQIELADPEILIAVGGSSAKLLLQAPEGILRLRGNWRSFTTLSGKVIPVMPTLHPAYLLRTPAHKKFAWRDFLEVKVKMESTRVTQ